MISKYQILCNEYDELLMKNYNLAKENRRLKGIEKILKKHIYRK